MVFRDDFFGCFCGGKLQARRAHAYTVRSCPQCGGAWVGHGDLLKMLQIMADPGREAAPLIRLAGRDSRRTCPSCRKPMMVVTAAGEQLDECAEHGVWFDREELGRVLYRFMDDDVEL